MTLKCRHCGGAHLTFKCTKINKNVESKNSPNKNNNSKNNSNKNSYNKNNSNKNSYNKNSYNKKSFVRKKKITVKMENLPDDVTIDELTILMKEWGQIGKINLNYSTYKIAYIEFYNTEEAEWFVDAIDGTPFDHNILHTCIYRIE